MPFTVPFKSFNGGEISPDLNARTDQAKYQSGLANCRNFFVRLEGSASNRSGTGFVCPLIKFSDGPARLIPFVFNDEQSYQLLIHWTGTETRLLVIKNGFPVISAGQNIASATSATPPIIRILGGHSVINGDLIYIASAEGVADIGNRWFQAQDTGPATEYISLWEEAAVVGAGYTYAPTGIIRLHRAYSVALPGVLAAQIVGLRYTQSADVVTFVHDELPPFNVTRLAEDIWTCANVVFDPSIAQPDGGAISVAAGSVTLRYRITAVSDDTGEESFPGLMSPLAGPDINLTPAQWTITKTAHGFVTADEVYFYGTNFSGVNGKQYVITVTGANTFTLNGTTGGLAMVYTASGFMARTSITNHNAIFPAAANTAVLTWTAVPNTSGYNIYRETNGVFSYVGTAVGTRFEDLGYTADSLNTPPIPLDYFNLPGKYPGAAGYYQQRLILGGPSLNPEEVRASRIGAFYNFTRSSPTQSDDALKWIMASGQVNQVRHLADMGKLLVFTQGAVFSTEGDDAGTLTPQAINPRKRADYGIGDIRPLTIGQVVIYVQTSGKIVREMEPNSFGVYASRDLTSFVKHLFEANNITSLSYAEEPFGIIWAVRSDGTLLGMTYLKEHAVDGWHHHDTGAGDAFLDVSCIPENNESATYVLVSRLNCNGQTRTYCERMASRTVLTPRAGRFLDSFVTYNGRNVTTTSAQILHYDYTKSLTVISNVSDFDTWSGVIASAVINNATSSTGASGGDTISATAGTGPHGITSTVSLIGGNTYTFEAVLAAGTEDAARISVFDGVNHYANAPLTSGGNFGFVNLVSFTNTNAGLINGYRRLSITFVASATGPATLGINILIAGAAYSFAGGGQTIKAHTATFSGQTTLLYWIESTGTTRAFEASDVGREIVYFLSDNTELRCRITSINVSPSYALVTPVGNIALLSLPYTSSSWALARPIIGGLWPLNGRSVRVMGEGEALGPFTVTNGQATLPTPMYETVTGLQIVSELETLEPDNAQGETWADKTKAMAELTLKVRSTLGISVGLNAANLQPFNDRWCTPGEFADGELYTGKLQVISRATLSADGKVFIRQDQPLACTVLGVYARLEIGEV